MPEQRKLTDSVTRAGKQALASDTGQIVVSVIADKVQELAQDKAEDVSKTIKAKAAKAAGRKPPPRKLLSDTQRAAPSAVSTVKRKADDAVSAVGSAPKNVGSGVKKVGSAGAKAAGALAEHPVLAATGAAALGGGAALARHRLSKDRSSSSKKASSK